jgi:hypothetical protein
MLMCTGYYDYDQPLSTVIPGIENFAGKVVHPQFWPEDLDYTNKSVVVIGLERPLSKSVHRDIRTAAREMAAEFIV